MSNGKENIPPEEKKEENMVMSVTVSKDITTGSVKVTAKGPRHAIDILGFLRQGLALVNAEFLIEQLSAKQKRIIRSR